MLKYKHVQGLLKVGTFLIRSRREDAYDTLVLVHQFVHYLIEDNLCYMLSIYVHGL